MAVEGDVIYKDRDAVIAELIAAIQARIPDANLTADSIFRILVEVFATPIEGLYLAWQLLHNDMFIQTANGVALLRYGEMYGRPIKGGVRALGSIRVAGAGGTNIPIGTQVAAPQAADEALTFSVSVSGIIPNPGVPTAPTIADAGAGTGGAGTFQFAVTFQTNEGETALGAISAPLTVAVNHNINVTAIPIGGPGTIARNLYISIDGAAFYRLTDSTLVAALNNNTTTSVTVGSGPGGNPPPTDSTAEQVTIAAIADDVGPEFNVGIGTITDFVSALPGLATVTNAVAFTGGDDEEDIEEYRNKLLEWVRAPESGSPADLKAWAEAVDGVESATVFSNDNLGTPTNGHATIRVSGPNGAVPSSDVINAVQIEVDSHKLANIITHVTTFTPVAINVAVVITLQSGYVLADITSSVQSAIIDYINSVQVGGTVYRAGITEAVFGLPGVATLTVTTPASDTTVASTQKAIPGTIGVS